MPHTATAPPPAPPAYRVDDLLVDLARASVTRGDVEIALPKLSFDLLVACIEAAPAIVSVGQLMDRVWPGLVVSPETVSQRVKLLRDALGDDSKSPRYLAAVRLRGYRLVPQVQRLAEPGALVEATPTGRPWLGRAGVAIIAAVVLAVAGVLWFAGRDTPESNRSAAAIPVRSIAVLPFENLSSAEDGEILAFGIPETILHQLANVPELVVIARTSSFALADDHQDVRDVGRRLNVRFLLEGSVQRLGQHLRITSQLVDTQTGAHVWSLQFDRTPQDVFAMQDEIALQVVRALQVSLDPQITEKLTGTGTANFDAYLAYLQGRAVMAKWQVASLRDAVEHFSQATELDPSFAPAYVQLAAARLRQAEFEVSDDRQERFSDELQQGMKLIDKALQLDPQNGAAYAERASFEAYTDLAAAEADYRRGIALTPNYAPGYAGLAAVLYEDPQRRVEALAMLERARKLDPLEPTHDVTKAIFLLYGRSDVAGAEALLTDVLKRDPLNPAALARLGEIRYAQQGQIVEGIKLLEQALSLDPAAEYARRFLLRAYLSVGDLEAAQQVADEARHRLVAREIPIYLYSHDWRRAGEAAYAAVDSETNAALDEPTIAAAIRLYARATGDYTRAIETLTDLAGVGWDEKGNAVLRETLDMKAFPTALGDMLQASGDEARARSVLRATLASMDRESKELHRGDLWYLEQRHIALALLGEKDAALDGLHATITRNVAIGDTWMYFDVEPSVALLRDKQRFVEIRASALARVEEERKLLAKLRAAGLVRGRRG
jgi:TolB-like protein/DNA-binding winged helix-turn-helix (wHTH) protein/Tfp pilus assembly protein PilF